VKFSNAPAGAVMAAVGTDLRKEEYTFNGDARAFNTTPAILDARLMMQMPCLKSAVISARSTQEFTVPVFKNMEVTLAGSSGSFHRFRQYL
jgi:iron complex outermembrane receptor protein